MRVPLYIAAALSLSGCSTKERRAAIKVIAVHIPDPATARYGSLYHLKDGYDCIDVTFERPPDHSLARAAVLLQNRNDHLVFKMLDEGNTCDELPHR